MDNSKRSVSRPPRLRRKEQERTRPPRRSEAERQATREGVGSFARFKKYRAENKTQLFIFLFFEVRERKRKKPEEPLRCACGLCGKSLIFHAIHRRQGKVHKNRNIHLTRENIRDIIKLDSTHSSLYKGVKKKYRSYRKGE